MSEKFYEKFEKKQKSSTVKRQQKKNTLKSHSKNNDSTQLDNSEQNKHSSNGKLKSSRKKNKNDYSGANNTNFKKIESLFNTKKITKETNNVLQNFDEVIQGIRPLNSKQLQQLPDNIRDLSHQLTDRRNERRLGYMNDNVQLSSYVRYYTWWNLVRLTRLFSNLPSTSFPQKDCTCLDLGTGPLTVINALWLARPELRKLKLTWYCLDVSSNSMILGEDIYLSLAAKMPDTTPWNIIRVKGSFGTKIKQKADFITCANMLNELDQASDMPPEFQSKKYFEQLKVYGSKDCKYLLIEPGVPAATRTLALLRERFITAGKQITAPCPHHFECPMNGFKAYTGSSNKWCNFAFSTEDAPVKLLKLSELAKLPKERATLIFISVVNIENKNNDNINQENKINCRITSDPFKLPDYKIGYYACSELGLTLLKTTGKVTKNPNYQHKSGDINEKPFIIEGPLNSGDLIQVKIKTPVSNLEKDQKSGAVIIQL